MTDTKSSNADAHSVKSNASDSTVRPTDRTPLLGGTAYTSQAPMSHTSTEASHSGNATTVATEDYRFTQPMVYHPQAGIRQTAPAPEEQNDGGCLGGVTVCCKEGCSDDDDNRRPCREIWNDTRDALCDWSDLE